MKSFNLRLQTAKKAHELSSSFVTLPSDYGFHEGVPYTVVGISNLKTMDTFLQSGQRLDNAEKKALVEALLKMLIQVHSGGVIHYGLCSLSIHQGKESFSSTSIGVVDFGLVPSEGHSYFSSPAQDEKLLSVASYAAPEQAAGRGDVDHRADLYSLGVLIYRLLTGHVPFEAGSVDEILKKVTGEPPPGLDGDKGFPDDIGGFMKRALEKNPKDRFQSAADMMESFLEASRDLPGEIVVKDRVRPSEPAEKGHAPVVILKVSEKDADKMDEASSQEITAEIGGGAEATTEPRSGDADLARKKATHKTDLFIQVPDKVRGDKEASGSGGDQIKKTRDKTDLFIKGPDQAQEGEPDKPGPEKAEKAQAAKPSPMKPIFKPVKAKEKTELFIKAEAREPGQADKKDVKPAKAGGVLQAFLKKKEKTIPPVDVKPETPKAEAPGARVPQGQQVLDDEKTSEISIEMDMEDGTYKIEEKTPGKAEPKKEAEKGEYVEFGKAPDADRPEEKKAAEKKPTALKRPSEKIKKRPVPTEDVEKPAIGRIQLKEPRKLVSKPPPKKEVASAKKDEVIKPVPPPPIIRAADKGPDKKAEAKKEVPKPPVPGMDMQDKDEKKKEAAAPAAEPEKKAEVVEKEVTIEKDAEKAKKMKLYVGIGAVAAVLIVIISIILISSSGNEASNEGQETSTETQPPAETQPPSEGQPPAATQPPAEEAEGSEAEAQEEPAEGEEEAASASQEPGTEESAEKPEEETPPEKEPAAPVKKTTTKKTPTTKKAATKKATTKKATTKKTPTTKKTTTKKGKKSGLEFVD